MRTPERTSRNRNGRTLIGLVAGLTLVAAACGSDTDDSVPTDDAEVTTALSGARALGMIAQQSPHAARSGSRERLPLPPP